MIGKQFGSYVVESKIGEGGMGVVWAAKHARMNQQAVVKVLRRHLVESPEMARRFENEANAAASIGHPGIVQVFDIGQQDDGSLYIVMELLAGESLQDRIDRLGKLSVEHAVRLVIQCADALGAAHAAGITHRDLKPDNIFVVPDALVAGGERVKLLDFGIAKLQVEGMATMGTAMGSLMGTPPYMSPEQCQGAGGVQTASDLYSLGCILFQLVTGRTPFVGKGPGEYIVAHTTKDPPLLRSFAPHAPQALEDVVSLLLAKKPENRFANCAALCAALGSVEGGDTLNPVRGKSNVSRADSSEGASPRMARTDVASEVSQPAPQAVPKASPKSVLQPHPAGNPDTTLGLSAGQGVTGAGQQSGYGDEAFLKPRGARAKVAAMGAVLTLALAGVVLAVMTGDKTESPTAKEVTSAADQASGPVADENSSGATDTQSDTVQLTVRLAPPDASLFVDGVLVPPKEGETTPTPGGAMSHRILVLPKSHNAKIEARKIGFDASALSILTWADESVTIELSNSVERRARTRLWAWQNKELRARVSIASESAGSKASWIVGEDKSELKMRINGTTVFCGLTFGPDGNPAELSECRAIEEDFSIEPTSFACSSAAKRIACKANKISARVDGDPMQVNFEVSRELLAADSEELGNEVMQAPLTSDDQPEVPDTSHAEATLPAAAAAKARRSAWMDNLVGAFFKVAGERAAARGSFRVVKDRTKIFMKIDGERVNCLVDFGSDGNPGTLGNCQSNDVALHITPTAFQCAVSKKELVCKAANFKGQAGKEKFNGSFSVKRPAIPADMGSAE